MPLNNVRQSNELYVFDAHSDINNEICICPKQFQTTTREKINYQFIVGKL